MSAQNDGSSSSAPSSRRRASVRARNFSSAERATDSSSRWASVMAIDMRRGPLVGQAGGGAALYILATAAPLRPRAPGTQPCLMGDSSLANAPQVITERRDAVLVVRINRPEKRNALNGAVMAGIGRAISEAD